VVLARAAFQALEVLPGTLVKTSTKSGSG
jgi:hypothetical protein